MSQQGTEYMRDISKILSIVLDDIGYSQEDRNRKLRCVTGKKFFSNIGKHLRPGKIYKAYMFGSRGEGATGPGLESDQDSILEYERANIVTDLSDCQLDKTNMLLLNDQFTHPGYVKLQRLKTQPDGTPDPNIHFQEPYFIVDSYGRALVSNKLFWSTREFKWSGPALHAEHKLKELSCDYVTGLRCKQWPNEALEWFQRRRLHGWPKSHYVKNARRDCCFAVGVGHPHSDARNVEWRLSFSFTERELIRSFEDTEMKVYILLKMIKETYITPVLGDAFTSYSCKVCMLWMKEKTPPELWCTENLIYCLTLCIMQLHEWVNNGYCPDYFIVTNNIYDRKIYGPARIKLSNILANLVTEDCRMVFGITCGDLGQDLQKYIFSETIYKSKLVNRNDYHEKLVDYQIYIEEAARCRMDMLRDIPQDVNILTHRIKQILHDMQDTPHTLQIDACHLLMNLLSRVGFYIVSVCKENIHSLSREEVDYRMTLARKCLSLGINSDATSVRLKLCGIGTMFGNYDLTKTSLQYISDHKMKYICSCKRTDSYVIKCYIDFNKDKIKEEIDMTKDLLQNQTSFSIIYLPCEISITPIPLRMEMYRSIGAPPAQRDKVEHFWNDWAIVDSFMCLHFFQYLNFLMLRNERHKMAAVEKMLQVIRTETDIPNRETELNLLGYCFMRESQVKNAFICFKKSMTICPHHNAAKFHLGFLFQKFHIARLRH